MASAVVDRLRRAITETPDRDEVDRRTKHYIASCGAHKLEAMLTVAAPLVAVDADRLDKGPNLLACRNGTVDLRTGELRAADPDDLLTMGVDLDYDPGAHSPEWGAVPRPHLRWRWWTRGVHATAARLRRHG